MMYSYNAYKECVIDLLKQKLGAENVSVISIMKNNGVKKEGVKLVVANHAASPVLYFEDSKGIYTGEDADEFLKYAMEVYGDTGKYPAVNIQEILSWDKIKETIRVRLINFERNKEVLQERPHIRVLDMAVYFSLPIQSTITDYEAVDGSVAVTNRLKESWNIDTDSLFKQAMINMINEPYVFCNLNEIMKGLGCESPLYFFSIYGGINGAVAILNRRALLEICEALDSQELYILPSSVHETLILKREDVSGSPDFLKSMVMDVNRTSVREEEYLSDSVYLYDNEKSVLQMVGDDYDQDRLMATCYLAERAG